MCLQVLELEANEAAGYDLENEEGIPPIQEESPASWRAIFREQRQQIIELWDVCNVSIIHRTQFYLLFKGDPADQIYMEVELRRLTWLQQHLAELGNASPARVGNEPTISLSSRLILFSTYTWKFFSFFLFLLHILLYFLSVNLFCDAALEH